MFYRHHLFAMQLTKDLGGAGAGAERQSGAIAVTLGRENVDLDLSKGISGRENGTEMTAWQTVWE